jgi:TolA-binding protein
VTAKAAPKTVPAMTGIPQPPLFSSNTTSRQKATQAPGAEINLPPTGVHPVPAKTGIPQPQPASNTPITSGQKLFEQAIKSYRTGDCQTAIQIFSQFLAEDTTSKLAADASLLIADCYLKLSGK